jgi:arylsulfatase A-like enzyme
MSTVLVTLDAVRADHLAQYEGPRDTMPALDRLMDRGTLFESAFANGPHSGVSIPSFLTSQYRGTTALEHGPNLATALSQAGVHTAAFHSNTMISDALAGFAGFDRIEDFGLGGEGSDRDRNDPVDHSTLARVYNRITDLVGPVAARSAVLRGLHAKVVPPENRFDFQVYVNAATLTDRVLDWLSGRDDGEFFLWVHYMDPHRPYGIDLEDPVYARSSPSDSSIRSLMARAGRAPEGITPDEETLLRDLYDSDLRYTSSHLNRLLNGIDRQIGLGETLVVLTADHGEEFGEHGRYFHRNYPYDELLHVPLVVAHPHRDPDRVKQPRELLDVAPTVCAHHDVRPPTEFRGQELFTEGERRPIATGSLRTDAPVVSLRDGDWKLIHIADAEDELYDIETDPRERRNVVSSDREQAESMKDALPRRLLTVDAATDPDGATGATRRRLERLGYLE